jgi:hypothetical protein
LFADFDSDARVLKRQAIVFGAGLVELVPYSIAWYENKLLATS